MKRSYVFAAKIGTVQCALQDGREVEVPVFPGILKHPTTSELFILLARPEVAEKYTREALRVAPWPILREFPRDWLRENLLDANIRPGRRKALLFLLDARAEEKERRPTRQE